MQNKYKFFSLTVLPEHCYTPLVIDFLIQLCRLNGFEKEESEEIGVAVDEVCSNIINYGFGKKEKENYKLEIFVYEKYMEIKISDKGIPFDPTQVQIKPLSPSIEDREIGKLGLKIVYSFMDKVSYEYDKQKGNVLSMIRFLKGKDNAN